MYATSKFKQYGMIDTIRLKIPVKNVKQEKLLSISYKKEGQTRYKIFKDVINVGSYSPDINIFINNNSLLFLEFSLPKFLHSHNLSYAYTKDIIPVLVQIKLTLDYIMDTPPILMWEISRIDICSYIFSENPYDDIYLYQTLDYPRKKKYIYDTSVMFVGSAYSIKMYIKEDEFFKNDFKKIVKSDISKAYNLLDLSKNKIRFEISYRRRSLCNILKKKTIFVSDIIDNKKKLFGHTEKIKKQLYINIDPNKMKQKNLLIELQKRYKKNRALQLYSFYVFYYQDEPNKKIVNSMYSRSQVYRNLKAIKDCLFNF